LVPCTGASLDVGELRAAVRKGLPEYMVPSAFVILAMMPLNSSGKVDQKSLPLPQQQGHESTAMYTEPRTPVEKTIAAIFSEVLGVKRVGVDDDFFFLGGHSMIATRLLTHIRSALGVELTVRQLFESRTVAAMSTLVEARLWRERTEKANAAAAAVGGEREEFEI
jgi:acyl carrier protein